MKKRPGSEPSASRRARPRPDTWSPSSVPSKPRLHRWATVENDPPGVDEALYGDVPERAVAVRRDLDKRRRDEVDRVAVPQVDLHDSPRAGQAISMSVPTGLLIGSSTAPP